MQTNNPHTITAAYRARVLGWLGTEPMYKIEGPNGAAYTRFQNSYRGDYSRRGQTRMRALPEHCKTLRAVIDAAIAKLEGQP